MGKYKKIANLSPRYIEHIFGLQSSFFGNFNLAYEYVQFYSTERSVTHMQWDFPTRLPEKHKSFCQTCNINTLKLSWTSMSQMIVFY